MTARATARLLDLALILVAVSVFTSRCAGPS